MLFRKYKYMRLDGSSKLEDRRDMVEDFQTKSDIFVFLLSTRAGGLGINLTAADTVIFYDSDWNPTMDEQAMDRCHRLGQEKQVTVYRLVTMHTIEEKIIKRAKEKHNIQSIVIAGGGLQGELKPKEVVSMLLDDEEVEQNLQKQIDQRNKARGTRSNPLAPSGGGSARSWVTDEGDLKPPASGTLLSLSAPKKKKSKAKPPPAEGGAGDSAKKGKSKKKPDITSPNPTSPGTPTTPIPSTPPSYMTSQIVNPSPSTPPPKSKRQQKTPTEPKPKKPAASKKKTPAPSPSTPPLSSPITSNTPFSPHANILSPTASANPLSPPLVNTLPSKRQRVAPAKFNE